MKGLKVIPKNCTGCRSCEVACSFSKTGLFAPATSRIQVSRALGKGANAPRVRRTCDLCGGAPACVAFCAYGALAFEPEKVKSDELKTVPAESDHLPKEKIRDLKVQRILHVDLTSGRIWVEELGAREVITYLGGRGINAKLLYENVGAGTGAFDPGNLLIFGTGTLGGTTMPCSGRNTITAVGPATGLYCKSSVGGHLGAELKYAGYDYVAVRGAAKGPVYLRISDDHVEIRDASNLWGKGTRESDRLIREELGDGGIQTALIGPGGENRVCFASVVCSVYHNAARGGLGAVMGSKYLKAVAVRGTGALRPQNGDEFYETCIRARSEVEKDPTVQLLFNWGTSGFGPILNELGMYPTHNYQSTMWDGDLTVSGQYLEAEGYLKSRVACFGCDVGCYRFTSTKAHRYGKCSDAGPQLETACDLGPMCGHADTEAMLMGNHLCNDYGIDTCSTGLAVAWAMESHQRGVLKAAQADGLDLSFGNAETMLEMIHRIAQRKGYLGNLLADGLERASREIGGDSYKWAVQVRGFDMTMVDVRLTKGYGLAFVTNPRGVDHLTNQVAADYGFPEGQALIKKLTGDEKYAVCTGTEKKPEVVIWHENTYAACDALGMCTFINSAAYPVDPSYMAEFMSHALGCKVSEDDLMLAGRRIFTLERAFNTKRGLRRKDDVLPWRMMNEPAPDGPLKGHVTDSGQLEAMKEAYYQLAGWDAATGVPTDEALKALGLGQVCRNLSE